MYYFLLNLLLRLTNILLIKHANTSPGKGCGVQTRIFLFMTVSSLIAQLNSKFSLSTSLAQYFGYFNFVEEVNC